MKLSSTLQRFISLVFLVALSCPTLLVAVFRPKDRTSAIQSIYTVFINMVSRMFPASDEELRTNRAAILQTTRRKLMTSLTVLALKYARWFYWVDAARAELWRVAAVVIMLGSLSPLAAQAPPAASVGTCSIPDRPVTLDKGVEVAAPPGFDELAFYDKVTERQFKDLSPLLKNSRWTINYGDLTFDPIPYTHMEHISLAWTK